MTKIDAHYKLVKGPDGKTRIVLDQRAKDAKLDLCTRLKKQSSKKMKWKPAR